MYRIIKWFQNLFNLILCRQLFPLVCISLLSSFLFQDEILIFPSKININQYSMLCIAFVGIKSIQLNILFFIAKTV